VLKPLVRYANPGTYQVSETVTTDAGNNTLALSNYITVLENDPVNVYPTLSTGSLTIQLHDASLANANIQFSIYNMLGEKVYATTLVQYITQVTLNVAPGKYFFRAFDASGKPVSTGKLVIE
jgi:PKD repeat protein